MEIRVGIDITIGNSVEEIKGFFRRIVIVIFFVPIVEVFKLYDTFLLCRYSVVVHF